MTKFRIFIKKNPLKFIRWDPIDNTSSWVNQRFMQIYVCYIEMPGLS